MRRYWSRRAREDPFQYVDNQRQLRAADHQVFSQVGAQVLDRLVSTFDVSLTGDEDVLECERPLISEHVRSRGRAHMGSGPQIQHVAWYGSAIKISTLTRAATDAHLELERIENEGDQFCLALACRKP